MDYFQGEMALMAELGQMGSTGQVVEMAGLALPAPTEVLA